MATTNSELETFRSEVRAWLEESFPKSLAGRAGEVMNQETIANEEVRAWGRTLGAKGWGTPTWPAEYGGGGLSQLEAKVLNEELDRVGAFNPLVRSAGMGITMVGPTILEYGTEEQKQKHIPKICRGEVFWSLGYSEPNAGSDLASLATRAEDAGDHWMVNGQKTWTSGADVSDWCGVPGAHRHRRAQARRHQLPDPRHGPAGHRDASDPADRGRVALLRDLLQRRDDAEKSELLGDRSTRGWTVGKRLLQHERQSQTGARRRGCRTARRTKSKALAKEYVGVDADGRLADPGPAQRDSRIST